MQSKASTVEQYLAELPSDRREAIAAVRQVILKNLDKNYEEGMQYGMIGYYVPHRLYPQGYHCDPKQPLPFVCLASQKNYMSLYLWGAYTSDEDLAWFNDEWAKTGKKLDMGKSCLRFKKLDDLPLDLIGRSIKRTPMKKLIEQYEQAINRSEPAAKRPVKKKSKARAARKTST